MPVRFNPDSTSNLLAALDLARRQEDKALEEISTGRRVNKLSDDPSAAANVIQTRIDAKRSDQFLRNVSSVRGQLQAAESILNNVVTALTRGITLGVQGANGVLSQQDRNVIAQELRGIRDQVVGLANTTFQGNYLFAGTAVRTQPFVLDATAPSGVRYDGNVNVNTVEVSNGISVTVQTPGDQIFAAAGGDVFQALTDLITTLEAGDSSGAQTATNALKRAFDNVTVKRSFYGNALNQLENAESFLNREKIELSRRENDLVGADLAASATNLVRASDAREATLAAGARISQLSLLDFLR